MSASVRTLSIAILLTASSAFCTQAPDDCTDPSSPSATVAESERSLRYTLSWDQSGIEPHADQSWSLTSDTGVRWHITRGYLVSLRAELNPCDESNTPATCATHTWRSPFGPSAALAGHGDDAPDPSRRGIGLVESLTELSTHSEPPFEVSGPAHCQAHYLIHKAYGFTENLPNDVDMIGHSVWIEGEYTLPGQTEATPFTASTAYSNGHLGALLNPLTTRPTTSDGRSAAWEVRVERSLAPLFNGIHPQELSPEALADAILWNLVDHTEVQLIAE